MKMLTYGIDVPGILSLVGVQTDQGQSENILQIRLRTKCPILQSMPYSAPPITEAVIEIKFSQPLETGKLSKLNASLSKVYRQGQLVKNLLLDFELNEGEVQPRASRTEMHGFRLEGADPAELLILWPQSIVLSQLAPYPGWNAFIARFKAAWRVMRRVGGYREIARVGVRYINRIDIPFEDGKAEYEKHLNIYPRLPKSMESVDMYTVQTLSHLPDIGCSLRVNSGRIPSPLINHASFILDIDIAKEQNLPMKEGSLFDLLDAVRGEKNRIFEECVSDLARDRFKPCQQTL